MKNNKLHIFYRISDSGYDKIKLPFINNENCLRNFCKVFHANIENIYIIADNCSDSTLSMIREYINESNIDIVSVGNGAGTFNIALDKCLNLHDDAIIYFVENDYLHRSGAAEAIHEGFELGADFVSLYDHPDKYMDNINPYVEDGGEITKVFLSNSCHWKLTNSTTMTFATKVNIIKQYESILRKYTTETCPRDFDMWIDLRNHGNSLITPIPGYSTHGETAWLTPLIKWNEIC
jgi:hypothetical protein